jgi:hypothetical protein
VRQEKYRISYYAACLVAVISVGITTATGLADPLGLTRFDLALLAVAASMLVLVQSFLPRVNKPPAPRRKGMD